MPFMFYGLSDKEYNERVNIVKKGWGFEKIIANSELYCAKILYLVKDHFCSIHYHRKKDETFYIISGEVCLEYLPHSNWLPKPNVEELSDDDLFEIAKKSDRSLPRVELFPGDKFHIPQLMIHRFIGMQDSQIMEVSTQHFDDDSYRILKGD